MEPRNSPSLLENPDLLLLPPPHRRLLLLCGGELLGFLSFPSMPPALPQIAAPALLVGFWYVAALNHCFKLD
ncbi:hypothetical protein SLEP1_g20072 [Rubroshorea leprosula]|uniref:Uncharacterized protein n=1 Tax=Rubroshorea leprosula TaxID=152421 RepID=A0AAV5JAN7_9ROSI|nr:hypothetical protein SLEP1_g20072 [Rubroshorea leprosula]